MAEGYGVTPDELRGHAAHLEVVAEELDEIRRAGETTGLGAGAYGQICAMVPDLLSRFQEPLTVAIGAAALSVRDTVSVVRGVAAGYEAADEAAAAAMHDAGGD
ncbi:MAG TPA: type VII secretion target [Actinoplanes sp.]|nr:type VII secretion target [Actinoplanes sp.]